jgi:hypothetical protein
LVIPDANVGGDYEENMKGRAMPALDGHQGEVGTVRTLALMRREFQDAHSVRIGARYDVACPQEV